MKSISRVVGKKSRINGEEATDKYPIFIVKLVSSTVKSHHDVENYKKRFKDTAKSLTHFTLVIDRRIFKYTRDLYQYLSNHYRLSHSHRLIHASVHTKFFVNYSDEHSNHVDIKLGDDIKKICRALIDHPNPIEFTFDNSDIIVSPVLVTEVLRKLTNAGQIALLFFRWAEKQKGFKPTTESFHALIEALGKIRQFRLIWDMVRIMHSMHLLTKKSFTLIIWRYARARKVEEAIKTFELMEKFDLKLEVSDFNDFLYSLSMSGHVSLAQDIFYDLKSRGRFSPDPKTYTNLLEGWGKVGDFQQLLRLFHEMKDAGFEPNVVTYGVLINAYCKGRKYNEVFDLFYEMEKQKCHPSLYIYCTLIHGFGAGKRLNEALFFFEQSKTRELIPGLPLYNAVVGAYCWSQQFDRAHWVLEEMMRSGVCPNYRTYNIILRHLIRSQKVEEAYLMFCKMDTEFGFDPDQNTYTMMVKMFANNLLVDMALKVWNKMKSKGHFPCMHMYTILINCLCNANQLNDACKHFQEMMNIGIRPPEQLYNNLKIALLDAGKVHLAVEFGFKLDKLRTTPMSE